MTTHDPNPPALPEGGGPGEPPPPFALGQPATLVGARLADAVDSLHDPLHDLLLPGMSMPGWELLARYANAGEDEILHALIAAQGLELVALRRAEGKRSNPRHARQPGSKRAWPEGLETAVLATVARHRKNQDVVRLFPPWVHARLADGDARGESDDFPAAIQRAARWWKFLRDGFRALPAAAAHDLRTTWFGARNQEASSGCVGWAVADLLWRQSNRRLDVPSARYIWQGAKEMDDEDRPSSMIAGAGTSLRAALKLVQDFGYPYESELPSHRGDLYLGSLDMFYATIAPRRIRQIVNLGRDAKCWIAWLASGRPIACTLLAGRAFLAAQGPDAVIGKYDPREDGQFAHAVLLTGFRTAGNVRLAEEAARVDATRARNFPVQFLVRNSAGEAWGDRGHAFLDHADLRAQVGELYGVIGADEADEPHPLNRPPA